MTKIIVVTGWDRSGSTLVGNALGSVGHSVAVGEIVNIWDRGFQHDRPCACGQPFSRCEFWGPIVQQAYGDELSNVPERSEEHGWIGNLWLVRRELPWWGAREQGRDRPYRDLLAPLFRAIADRSGAELIVDASKTPWHSKSVEGLRELMGDDIDVFVLHVVRDPRAVAHSLRKKVQYDIDDDRKVLMDRHGVAKSTLAWVYRNRLTEWVWSRSANYMRLRYEDFVEDPQHWIDEVLKAAGVDGELHGDGDRSIDLSLSHSVSGNPMRFQHGSVEVRLDDAWRSKLPRRTQWLVRLYAFGHMRHFGYR